MEALLWLRFEERGGETIVRLKQQQPPWRVIRGFPTGSGEALAHLHNVSGGILDNDDLRLRVEVGAGARAQLTTTGATRVYRSRPARVISRQQTDVVVCERGLLEYLPDPLIPYAQSRFQQSITIELCDEATLFWWETIAPGREAAGELFAYDILRSALELRACGKPIALERFAIEPKLRHPESPARLGPFRYFCSFYVCQTGRATQSWVELESQLGDFGEELSRPNDVLWGVSRLPDCGLVIRGVALKGRRLTEGLPAFWRVAKWFLCGQIAAIPRKMS